MRFTNKNSIDYSFAANKKAKRVGNNVLKILVLVALKL